MSSDRLPRSELLQALGQAMRQASAQSVLLSQAVADRLSMHSTDLESLDLLSWTGPITAGQLAELTGLTTGAITGVIDRLEQAGYVQRSRDESDRRRVIIQPLTKHEQTIDPLFASLGQAIDELAARYSDDQLAAIFDFFNRMVPLIHDETTKLRAAPAGERPSGDFVAPLDGVSAGRLTFVSGAARLTVKADPDLADLYRAHFEGPVPTVKVDGGNVSIQYPRFRFFEWRRHAAEIVLNSAIPWAIEIRGGASEISADLSRAELSGFELSGGASRAALNLARSSGTVLLRLTGGASDITIHRPSSVPVRVHVRGGISKLNLDGRRVDAFGSDAYWETPGFLEATDRYEIEVLGGASRLTVDAHPLT